MYDRSDGRTIRPVLILLTNDDGILAPGLAAMHAELCALGEVDVVAPSSGMSASGHSITIDYPVISQRLHVGGAFHGESVRGQPADCVKLAMKCLLRRTPDLVVSGINNGENVGIHVLYSGTVAAAAEGAMLGAPAIAVSLETGPEMDFARAAQLARGVIDQLLARGVRSGELYNVNIPALKPGWPRGVRVCRQSTLPIEDEFEVRTDPRGRQYYWLRGEFGEMRDEVDTDLHALREGYITVTPLHVDLTDRQKLVSMQSWAWPPIDHGT